MIDNTETSTVTTQLVTKLVLVLIDVSSPDVIF